MVVKAGDKPSIVIQSYTNPRPFIPDFVTNEKLKSQPRDCYLWLVFIESGRQDSNLRQSSPNATALQFETVG